MIEPLVLEQKVDIDGLAQIKQGYDPQAKGEQKSQAQEKLGILSDIGFPFYHWCGH
jgi:hypothetical protein